MNLRQIYKECASLFRRGRYTRKGGGFRRRRVGSKRKRLDAVTSHNRTLDFIVYKWNEVQENNPDQVFKEIYLPYGHQRLGAELAKLDFDSILAFASHQTIISERTEEVSVDVSVPLLEVA